MGINRRSSAQRWRLFVYSNVQISGKLKLGRICPVFLL